MLKIVEKAKIWFTLSIIVILIGAFFLVKNGLNFGIDFKGGTILVVDMGKEFDNQEVQDLVRKYAPDGTTNVSDVTKVEIKSNALESEKVTKLMAEMKDKYGLKDNALVSQDEIGASVGQEMTSKALIALSIATIAMLIYVGIRFEFNFGAAAIIALIHDVLTTLAIYAIFQVPVNSPFIAAMLTVIGYSINDTIVIFDRIRENQKNMRKTDIADLANISITQTMTRSINTVATVLITVVAVYFIVPSVRDFAFPLVVGIFSGAYSSVFIASPLWVIFKKARSNKAVRA